MKRFPLSLAGVLAALLLSATTPALAQDTTAADSAAADTTTQAAPPPAPQPPVQDTTTADTSATETVVGVIQASPDHTTLARAIGAADLASVLEADGPFTIFAPTDAAFEALPPGRLDSLLQPSRRADLRALLRRHAIIGDLTSARLATRIENGNDRLETVHGDSLQVAAQGRTVTVGDATVTQADLPASNGVVHVVDAVLVPAPTPSTMQDTTTPDMPQRDTAATDTATTGVRDIDGDADAAVQDDAVMDDDTIQNDAAMQDTAMTETPRPQEDADAAMADDAMMDDEAMANDAMAGEDAAEEARAAMVPKDTTLMVRQDTTVMVSRDTTIMVPRDTTLMVPRDTTMMVPKDTTVMVPPSPEEDDDSMDDASGMNDEGMEDANMDDTSDMEVAPDSTDGM